MTNRIQNAIDVFLDAINKGTLAKGLCCACAVGNLVAHGKGGKISSYCTVFKCDAINENWGIAFGTSNGKQRVEKSLFSHKDVQKDVAATEFTIEELMAIEYAFECNTRIESFNYSRCSKEEIRADQIRGLEAVVKVMLKFDEQLEDVKELFTEKAEALFA